MNPSLITMYSLLMIVRSMEEMKRSMSTASLERMKKTPVQLWGEDVERLVEVARETGIPLSEAQKDRIFAKGLSLCGEIIGLSEESGKSGK